MRTAQLITAIVVALASIAGCERAPSNNSKVTSSQPQPIAPASQPETAPAVAPPPATASAPVDEKPAYVEIVERRDAARPAKVNAEVRDRNWLVITTQNVRRMKVRNETLPIEGTGSVVLRIDGKVIEWLRKQSDIELVRSANDEWTVPAPGK